MMDSMGKELEMFKLFIGIILTLLNYNVDIGFVSIGIIPDFLGYIVLYKGVKELSGESRCFRKIQKYVTIMTIFSGIMYIVSLVVNTAVIIVETNTVLTITFIYTTMRLYIIFNIVKGIMEIENRQNISLRGSKLMIYIKGTAISFFVANGLALMDSILGISEMILAVEVSLLFISFIFELLFIVAMIRTYYLYKKVDYGKII